MPWVFRTYRRANGRDDVREWHAQLSPTDRAKVLTILQYLRDQPRDKWMRPDFDQLRGKSAGLGEIRCKLSGVQHRLIGCFGPGRMNFTLLVVVIKKGRTFEPRDWEKIAVHSRDVVADPRCADAWL
jgi:Phage derived protein Gp49-like (DUF891)